MLSSLYLFRPSFSHSTPPQPTFGTNVEHHPTLFYKTYFARRLAMSYDVGRCFTKFTLISVKHRKTFLLFPTLMNNVGFAWTACKTLLDSRSRTRPSLILIWAYSVPESLSFTMFYKTCFTLLDSFGHPVKQCWMMFYDVLLV